MKRILFNIIISAAGGVAFALTTPFPLGLILSFAFGFIVAIFSDYLFKKTQSEK